MKRYDPSRPLISVHIPKCAGTSLAHVLRTWFGSGGYYTHYVGERQGTPPARHRLWGTCGPEMGLDRPVCVHGHFNRARGLGVDRFYPEVDQLITVIRDPFAMCVSNYRYVRDAARLGTAGAMRDGAPHPIIRNDWSLRDFVACSPRSYLLDFLPAELNRDNFAEVLERTFLYVGVAECLDASVADLAQLLGFPPIAAPLENRSSAAVEGEESLRDLFEAANPLEMEVFRHVRRQFEQRRRPAGEPRWQDAS